MVGPLLGRPGFPDGFIGSEEGLIPGGKICAWLNAARRAAFSTLSWSTNARHSSHRLLASSAEARAASSSCDLLSRAFTCLCHRRQDTEDRIKQGIRNWSRRSLNARCAFLFCSARLLLLNGRPPLAEGGGDWEPCCCCCCCC